MPEAEAGRPAGAGRGRRGGFGGFGLVGLGELVDVGAQVIDVFQLVRGAAAPSAVDRGGLRDGVEQHALGGHILLLIGTGEHGVGPARLDVLRLGPIAKRGRVGQTGDDAVVREIEVTLGGQLFRLFQHGADGIERRGGSLRSRARRDAARRRSVAPLRSLHRKKGCDHDQADARAEHQVLGEPRAAGGIAHQRVDGRGGPEDDARGGRGAQGGVLDLVDQRLETNGVGSRSVELTRADELELHLAELDEVAGFEQSPLEKRSVDADAVGARLVDDLVAPAAQRVNLGVDAAHRRVRDRKIELGRPPDTDDGSLDQELEPGLRTNDDHEPIRFDGRGAGARYR